MPANLPVIGNHATTSPSAASSTSGSDHLTLAVLGCGTMGIAILKGILDQLAEMDAPRPLQVIQSSASVTSLAALHASHAGGAAGGGGSVGSATAHAGAPDEMPDRLPTRFLACVRRAEAGKRVRAALWSHSSVVKVVVNDNVHAAEQANVVILACQPAEADALLAAPGMARALAGKLLISVCAGITAEHIDDALYGGGGNSEDATALTVADSGRCLVVRAIPNAGSLIGESMTVIDTATALGPLPADQAALVTWIFRRIGSVVHHPHKALTSPAKPTAASRAAASSAAASTALGTAGPAFFALVLEAAIDGAVALGMKRSEAQLMAAQSMRGAAGLVLQNNEHPALLRDRISTPGGCAAQGLVALEEGGVRSTIARALREATAVAAQE